MEGQWALNLQSSSLYAVAQQYPVSVKEDSMIVGHVVAHPWSKVKQDTVIVGVIVLEVVRSSNQSQAGKASNTSASPPCCLQPFKSRQTSDFTRGSLSIIDWHVAQTPVSSSFLFVWDRCEL